MKSIQYLSRKICQEINASKNNYNFMIAINTLTKDVIVG